MKSRLSLLLISLLLVAGAPPFAGAALSRSLTSRYARPVAKPLAIDDPANIAAAVPAERDEVALVEAFKKTGPLPRVARTTPLDVKVGAVETFWVTDLLDDTNYTVKAALRYAGPIVLMYVDTSLSVDQAKIERSSRSFEVQIYTRTRALFG